VNVHKEPIRRKYDIANEIVISDITHASGNSDNNNGEPIEMRDDQLLSQVPLRANNEDYQDLQSLRHLYKVYQKNYIFFIVMGTTSVRALCDV
jgi:hypothetical protein